MKTEYSSLPFDVRKNLKLENIENGNYAIFNRYYKQEMKALFSTNDNIPDEFLTQQINDSRLFYRVFENDLPLEYKACTCIKNCEIAKRKRLRTRIQNYVRFALTNEKKALFLTLTFTNEFLENTTDVTRRRYVTRWLKENCLKYIANIDFGKQFTEREHYHAIVVVDKKIDYTSWVGGACNGENIRLTKKSTEEAFKKNTGKLANYINKLTQHGLKDSTMGNKLIYSRN